MKTNTYKRLRKEDAVMVLVDHQTGLISGLVRDWNDDSFQNNVEALVDIANFFDLPTILTTSFETGPNGPLIPYIKENLKDAPIVKRPGQINAWDNEEFVEAIKATGKKQLIVAGVVTEVCTSFVTLSALEAEFEVFPVIDASGTTDPRIAEAAIKRMNNAGAELMSWFTVAAELQRDWRNDEIGFGNLLSKHYPAYKNVYTSFEESKK